MDLLGRAREAGRSCTYLEMINIQVWPPRVSTRASSVACFLLGQKDSIQRPEGEGWIFFFFSEGFFFKVESSERHMQPLFFNGCLTSRTKSRARLCSPRLWRLCYPQSELSGGLIPRVTLLVTPGVMEEPITPAPDSWPLPCVYINQPAG